MRDPNLVYIEKPIIQNEIIMKICIVTHNILKGDGQGRVNYEVAREAALRGHQVTLLASRIDEELLQIPQITWVPVSGNHLPTNLLKTMIFSWSAGRWIRKHHTEYDIIQGNGAATPPGSCKFNAVHFVHNAWLKSPSHISKQTLGIYSFYQWLFSKLNAYWEISALRDVPCIISVSNKVKADLIDIGISEKQITTIINGVDLDEFKPRTEISQMLHHELSLNLNTPLGLFAGDIRTNRKNLDSVLRAVLNVKDMHLVVIGETSKSPYPKMVDDLGLTDRIHFLGYRKDIARLMRGCDFFVFPSRYEACTLVLLEALASGLPAITAVSTGGSEIVESNCGIVLDDSEDISQLVEALGNMSEDLERTRSMSASARQVAEKYSWQVMANTYLHLFSSHISLDSSQNHPDLSTSTM